jgi:3-hydroxyisobutyrate dehydrogenase
MANIAFLGLGAMGSRMASNLAKAGHAVTVWNRDPTKATRLAAARLTVASTPRAAAVGADFVLAMLRDDAAAKAVWSDTATGAFAGMARGALAIDCSTLSVGCMRDLAGKAAQAGVDFLDAPLAGSRPQADAGQLIFFVGGDASCVARAEPILKATGSAVHHAGPSGSGAAVKLLVNALFGLQVAAMGELIGLAEALGLDAARMVEIIAATPVCSPAAKGAAAGMLARNFAPQFPIDLAAKDFAYVLSEAARANAAVPMAAATARVLADAVAQGLAGDNITGVAQLFRRVTQPAH